MPAQVPEDRREEVAAASPAVGQGALSVLSTVGLAYHGQFLKKGRNRKHYEKWWLAWVTLMLETERIHNAKGQLMLAVP